MSLEHLRIDGVRCLNDVVLDLHSERNYLWGPNGAGKTSCLEGIYLLARGRSFRMRQTARLVMHGRSRLNVFGVVLGPDGQSHRLGVEFTDGRFNSRIDGEPAGSQVDMLRLLPVHVIDPRLHQLVEAGPSERRRYLDSGVFHVEHEFLNHWRHYRRVLGQRNAALKAHASDAELDAWTQPFIVAATAVDRARSGYVASLAEIAADQARTLVGHGITLEYKPGWREEMGLAEAISACRARDRALGFTQVGPHRADLKLEFDTGGVRETASRGQQKLVAAALVIAQVSLFESRTGQRSTLLVDDASAELDAGAQQRLRNALNGLQSQQVLTGLSIEALKPEAGFPVFHVEQGRVVPVV
ncbi:MAG: DNA replication/repair protein RecF [Gammaproteobacteria bacterium]|jgi:DNA replication and repair protein RecF